MLTLIPTPLGNLKDITIRALEHLATAEVVLCEDTRVAKSLFKNLFDRFEGKFVDFCNATSNCTTPINPQEKISLQKISQKQESKNGFQKINPLQKNSLDSTTNPKTLNPKSKQFIALHSHNEQDFLSTITPDFFSQEVIYISDAGMPSICDPGALLVKYAQKHNIPYNVLVGGCALSAAFCFSGFASQGFVFGGFLPHKSKERVAKLQECAISSLPTIWYESPHRILDSLRDIDKHLPDTHIFAIKEISKLHQRHFSGKASEILSTLSPSNASKKNSNDDSKILQGEWVLILEPSSAKPPCLTLCESDIISLEIPPKAKAKLLSTLTGKEAKTIYASLTKA